MHTKARVLERPSNSSPPTGVSYLPDPSELSGVVGAWHRALPFTRLIDYGMNAADAHELLWRTASGEDWSPTAADIGARQLAFSKAAAEDNLQATAQTSAVYSFAAFNVGQIVFNLDTPERLAAYSAFQSGVAWFASLGNGHVEAVSAEFNAGRITGWLFTPQNQRVDGTVVIWGGLSGWGASYVLTAQALLQRNIACILAEGPGQGTPRLEHGLVCTESTLPGYGRFVDLVLSEPRLGGKVGIQGNSFGGLMAARVAAADPRLAAIVINGATAHPVVPDFRSAREQILAFTGTTDVDAATLTLERLAFDSDKHRISAPTLVLRGGADPLVSEANQAAFLPGLVSPESRMLTWPDGEHTLYNHAAERDALTADWFSNHFHA